MRWLFVWRGHARYDGRLPSWYRLLINSQTLFGLWDVAAILNKDASCYHSDGCNTRMVGDAIQFSFFRAGLTFRDWLTRDVAHRGFPVDSFAPRHDIIVLAKPQILLQLF